MVLAGGGGRTDAADTAAERAFDGALVDVDLDWLGVTPACSSISRSSSSICFKFRGSWISCKYSLNIFTNVGSPNALSNRDRSYTYFSITQSQISFAHTSAERSSLLRDLSTVLGSIFLRYSDAIQENPTAIMCYRKEETTIQSLGAGISVVWNRAGSCSCRWNLEFKFSCALGSVFL